MGNRADLFSRLTQDCTIPLQLGDKSNRRRWGHEINCQPQFPAGNSAKRLRPGEDTIQGTSWLHRAPPTVCKDRLIVRSCLSARLPSNFTARRNATRSWTSKCSFHPSTLVRSEKILCDKPSYSATLFHKYDHLVRYEMDIGSGLVFQYLSYSKCQYRI